MFIYKNVKFLIYYDPYSKHIEKQHDADTVTSSATLADEDLFDSAPIKIPVWTHLWSEITTDYSHKNRAKKALRTFDLNDIKDLIQRICLDSLACISKAPTAKAQKEASKLGD